MKQKIIAIGAGITLATLAAVGAFASQDGVLLQELVETPTETPTETPAVDLPTETPVGTETPVATDTPTDATATPTPTDTPADATETPADATETPATTETPAATPTPADGDDEDDDDVHGIPDSNPVKHPEDGDGECEKGETVVKTTPSGTKVNVPCHADKHGGSGEEPTAGDEDGPGHKKGKGGR